MLNHTGTIKIETERLTLRQYRMGDAPDMFRNWVTDSEVTRFWGWDPHTDIEETQEILAVWVGEYAEPDKYHWVIVLKSVAQAIGYIYLNEIDEADESAAVHFLLGRAYWNRGLMTEACQSVLSFAFNTLQVKRIHTRHHVDNPASGRVMQKCGMRHVKTEHRHFPECEQIDGLYCYYEICKADWVGLASLQSESLF